ncbi:MAG TPA: 4Fe-4S dicluster domain-containing protein [Firmicutes bacterium]|nr:4Fe-4S dicluster domain-containing protein [Candidatus Fermentithermobacillaceae bacterium]
MITSDDLYLVIDLDRCWGCRACEVACKQEHDLECGSAPIQVVKIGPEATEDGLSAGYVPVMCQHCEQPACVDVCPAGAIARDQHGWVIASGGACIGCGACVSACQYGGIRQNRTDCGISIVKCDLCAERRNMNLPPACLQHCVGRALALLSGDLLNRVSAGRQRWSAGKVVYIASSWCRLGAGFGETCPDDAGNLGLEEQI